MATPSEINVLEASLAPLERRARLLDAVRDVARDTPLLPWTIALLKSVSLAIVTGAPYLDLPLAGSQWVLNDRDRAEALRDEIRAFNQAMEAEYSAIFTRFRPGLQRRLKSKKMGATLAETVSFLDDAWLDMGACTAAAEAMWESINIPYPMPSLSELRANEVWRLYLDSEGLALFQRAIVAEEPKRVQRLDLLQLPYLGLATRRVLVTSDKRFADAARAILTRRYTNATVVELSTMIE